MVDNGVFSPFLYKFANLNHILKCSLGRTKLFSLSSGIVFLSFHLMWVIDTDSITSKNLFNLG